MQRIVLMTIILIGFSINLASATDIDYVVTFKDGTITSLPVGTADPNVTKLNVICKGCDRLATSSEFTRNAVFESLIQKGGMSYTEPGRLIIESLIPFRYIDAIASDYSYDQATQVISEKGRIRATSLEEIKTYQRNTWLFVILIYLGITLGLFLGAAVDLKIDHEGFYTFSFFVMLALWYYLTGFPAVMDYFVIVACPFFWVGYCIPEDKRDWAIFLLLAIFLPLVAVVSIPLYMDFKYGISISFDLSMHTGILLALVSFWQAIIIAKEKTRIIA